MNIYLKKLDDKILTFSNIAEFDKSKIKEYNVFERSANGL